MTWSPCLVRSPGVSLGPSLGHPVIDRYLAFVAARARPNTQLAVGYDLKVFFSVTGKEPAAVTTADVLDFIRLQLEPSGARDLPAGGGDP